MRFDFVKLLRDCAVGASATEADDMAMYRFEDGSDMHAAFGDEAEYLFVAVAGTPLPDAVTVKKSKADGTVISTLEHSQAEDDRVHVHSFYVLVCEAGTIGKIVVVSFSFEKESAALEAIRRVHALALRTIESGTADSAYWVGDELSA